MNFASCLPDWNSLDSVRYVHSALELTSIISFGLLAAFDIWAHTAKNRPKIEQIAERIGLAFFAIAVAAEIGGYIYGQRNDTLSENVIRSLDALSKDAETKAGKAVTDSGNAITRADTASGRADTISGQLDSDETLVASVRSELARANERLIWGESRATVVLNQAKLFDTYLPAFKGQKVVFSVCMGQYMLRGDQEISNLANDLALIAAHNGWIDVPVAVPPGLQLKPGDAYQVFDESCGSIGQAVSVAARSDAPAETIAAGKVIQALVNTSLSQSVPLEKRQELSFVVSEKVYRLPADTLLVEVRMHPSTPTEPRDEDREVLKSANRSP